MAQFVNINIFHSLGSDMEATIVLNENASDI